MSRKTLDSKTFVVLYNKEISRKTISSDFFVEFVNLLDRYGISFDHDFDNHGQLIFYTGLMEDPKEEGKYLVMKPSDFDKSNDDNSGYYSDNVNPYDDYNGELDTFNSDVISELDQNVDKSNMDELMAENIFHCTSKV